MVGLKKLISKAHMIPSIHTQYSNIPLFQYSMWLMKTMAAKNMVIPVNSKYLDPCDYSFNRF